MRQSQPIEQTVGIEYYVSETDGTGGRLRAEPADFRVCEIEQFDAEPLEASTAAYPHLLVRVTLENWDTNDFASTLSDHLGISRERVSWAGTKDKRAVTTQLFSVDGIEPDALPNLSAVEFEVIGRTGRPILFGDLAGNEFEITVRDPDRPDNAAEIARELEAFGGQSETKSEYGHNETESEYSLAVPNYFGQQRFGSRRPVTHEVGLAIVRGAWEDAVLSYVGNPSDREPAATREARSFVDETQDWQAALERMPTYLGYERSMLHRLAESDADAEDFRAALETVPTNLQQLFVNAAQSYLFNRILSERIDRGLPFENPVEGDVVCFVDADSPDGFVLPDTDRTQEVTADRIDTVRRHCDRGRAFVTAPLVGTETEFGSGEPAEITRAVLDDVGIDRADFDKPGEFGSTGTRRAILLRTECAVGTDPLTFSFRLPRGSYATVLLREFLKCDPETL